MSTILELLSLILSSDVGAAGMDAANGGVQTCASTGALCPAESFTALGAAFATQGYYVQADLLFYLTHSSMGNLAPLLYVIAAVGGLTALALGAPPKMYLWFFIGPGIYHWLIETRLPAHGVQWTIAGIPQDQREVWKLAEVGLQNMPIVDRVAKGIKMDSEGANIAPSACKPAIDPVQVSYFFLYYDELVSSVIQSVVKWTGVFNQRAATATAGDGMTGINPMDTPEAKSDRWYLLANQKWGLLDSITSARASSSETRDLLATFLSSECGDALLSNIDKQNFAAASNAKSGRLPCSVIMGGNGNEADNTLCSEIQYGEGSKAISEANYEHLYREMQSSAIPIPASARRLANGSSLGSFSAFIDGDDTGKSVGSFLSKQDSISCPRLFYLLVEAFRWESAAIYHQIVARAPASMKSSEFLYNLFYGWNIRNSVGSTTHLLKSADIEEWTKNLILIHLLRNELAMTKRVADPHLSSDKQLENFSNSFIGQTGAKTKYSEIYSWARMIPYIQGIFLYILAMGYPFACVLIVMPGWHKSLFTWMSFWLWVKLWDVGFALVLVMERTIWSTIGNNSTIGNLSPLINTMKNWGSVSATCTTSGSADAFINSCQSILAGSMCSVPKIQESVVATMSDGGVVSAASSIQWWNAAAIFDRALLIGSSIDLDVSNGYYIYIMSALYFAVPAITGQLVLGAKAGMASFVGNFSDGAKADGSRASQQGFTAGLSKQAQGAFASSEQAARAAKFRQNGLAAEALEYANRGLDIAAQSGALDAKKSNLGLQMQNRQLLGQLFGSQMEAQQAKTRLGINSVFNPIGRTAGQNMANAFFSGGGSDAQQYAQIGQDQASKGLNDPKSKKAVDALKAADAEVERSYPAAAGQPPRGAAPGWSSGSTGASATGSGGPTGFNPLQLYQMTGQAGSQFAEAQTGVEIANAKLAFNRNQFDGQAEANATTGGLNLDSYALSSRREGFGLGGQRITSFGGFESDRAAYETRRDIATDVAPGLAALGADTSSLTPGSKPSDMTGMAMGGMLGSSAQSLGYHADYKRDGAYWGMRENLQSDVNGTYSRTSIQSAYTKQRMDENDVFKYPNIPPKI